MLQVFLDEVNTSSCVGLFKEIIVDRTFDGTVSTFDIIILFKTELILFFSPSIFHSLFQTMCS